MARVVVIANPAAARTRGEAVAGIERVFARAGWDVEVLATGGHGDARRLAQHGVESGADVVAVFGGDGTIMQAAAALVGTEVALGVIPGGTGNLLAGNLRLPVNPVRAAAALVRARPRRFDLGRMERPDGTHYFAVNCGTGLDARVMAATPTASKRRWGMMAYILTTLRILPEIASVPFRITVDGVGYDAKAAMLLVANCGDVIPPFLRLGQGISPVDGLLDVVALQVDSVGGGFRAVWDLFSDAKGTYGKDVFAAHARGAEIAVESAGGAQPVQLDGEPLGETPFVARVVPGAVLVLRPEG